MPGLTALRVQLALAGLREKILVNLGFQAVCNHGQILRYLEMNPNFHLFVANFGLFHWILTIVRALQ